MRRTLVVLAALLLWGGGRPAHAAPVPHAVAESWQEGNRLYGEGSYAEASDAYAGILQAGYTAPQLEYNLANASLKAGRRGEAILHYLRALALDPTYESARENLRYARSLIQGVKVEDAPERWGAFGRLRFGLPAAVWALLASVTLFAGVAAARLFIWRGRLGAMLLQGALGGLVLLAAAAVLFEAAEARRADEGVVLRDEVEVRAGPAETQTVSFRLPEGTEVELRRRAEGWREIKVSDGLEGWVPADAVEAIRKEG